MFLNVNTDWKSIIENEKTKDYWQNLEHTIDNAYKTYQVFPKENEIFKCLDYFNWQETKVVILGQDPYPTLGDANGLAFSVSRNVNLPHSLQNIFIELNNDLHIKRSNGDLTDWAKQGVLLLNTSLTFCRNQPNLLQLWNIFTKNIIEFIDKHLNGVVFILWGNYAKGYIPYIVNNKTKIISSGHPSFAQSHGKFFNTKPFSKANDLLMNIGKKPISW